MTCSFFLSHIDLGKNNDMQVLVKLMIVEKIVTKCYNYWNNDMVKRHGVKR